MDNALPAVKADTPPRWDLSDYYKGINDPQIEADLTALKQAALAFQGRYKSKLAGLDGAELAEAVAEYERIDGLCEDPAIFASLIKNTALTDAAVGRFAQTVSERLNKIYADILFFTLEINQIDDADLAVKLQTPALAHYKPWLDNTRAWRPHQLSEDFERLFMEKGQTGASAWKRLYAEFSSSLRFPFEGQNLTQNEALKIMTGGHDPVRRRAMAEVFSEVYQQHIRTFALITNTLAKDREIDDNWGNFSTPQASRHLANRVEAPVVDALVSAVKAAYPDLSHRYYALKAKWFGQAQIDYCDRMAPLPGAVERDIAWSEARAMVLNAYRGFSPEIADIGQRFFDNNWIDAALDPDKAPGAFSMSGSPRVHPYILMNFHGKSHDVKTLSHELGHGVHQVLAAGQGALMAGTPLTLAETASVFGEMLTFRSQLDAETDPAICKTLLAAKVEDMLATVVRQISFHDFECRVHAERREKGELSPERIGEHWLDTMRESLGPAVKVDQVYAPFWAYVGHFIRTPFYVYAYAFGDCLVNSLYGAYLQKPQGFQEKYLDMLRAGRHERP